MAPPLISALISSASASAVGPTTTCTLPGEGRITPGDPIDNYEVRLTKVPVVGGESIALRLLNRERLLRPALVRVAHNPKQTSE